MVLSFTNLSDLSLAMARHASAKISGSLINFGSIPKTSVTCDLIGEAGHNAVIDTP